MVNQAHRQFAVAIGGLAVAATYIAGSALEVRWIPDNIAWLPGGVFCFLLLFLGGVLLGQSEVSWRVSMPSTLLPAMIVIGIAPFFVRGAYSSFFQDAMGVALLPVALVLFTTYFCGVTWFGYLCGLAFRALRTHSERPLFPQST